MEEKVDIVMAHNMHEPQLAERSSKLRYCSFCGKSEDEAKGFVTGPAVAICGECVELAKEIIDEQAKEQ